MGKPISIYDQDLNAIKLWLSGKKAPAYRAKQIWAALYQQLENDFSGITTLPKSLQQTLQENYKITSIEPVSTLYTKDNRTQKTLFLLDNKSPIETVLMEYRERNTICVSTQSGCPVGCAFCATGQMGFNRNLTSGEIIEQVIYYARKLRENNKKITNIVLMGMGEPFLNFDATINAIDRMNHPDGLNYGERRFTISTVGIPDKIVKFADMQRQVNLAISLHAANNKLRDSLIPINHHYSIAMILDACRYYINKTNRRVSFEWALINDVNDSIADANQLASLLKGMLSHVNLIPLNPIPTFNKQKASGDRIKDFKSILERANIPCSIRDSRGADIMAGCGQLASRAERG